MTFPTPLTRTTPCALPPAPSVAQLTAAGVVRSFELHGVLSRAHREMAARNWEWLRNTERRVRGVYAGEDMIRVRAGSLPSYVSLPMSLDELAFQNWGVSVRPESRDWKTAPLNSEARRDWWLPLLRVQARSSDSSLAANVHLACPYWEPRLRETLLLVDARMGHVPLGDLHDTDEDTLAQQFALVNTAVKDWAEELRHYVQNLGVGGLGDTPQDAPRDASRLASMLNSAWT